MNDMTTPAIERVWPELGGGRVPAWIYSDETLFERELERFHHGRCWSYVGLECEVPTPGSYRRSFVGVKPVLITRDEAGEIHVLENRCSHRGAPVCWRQRGKGKKDLVCPYHEWTFSLSGELQGVPFLRGTRPHPGMPRDFNKAEHGLRRLKSTVRGGVIWASYALDAPDFETYAGPGVLRALDRTFPGRPLRLLGYSRQTIPANWKLYFENSRDPYHATLLHSFFSTFGLYRADAEFDIQPLDNGHETIRSFFASTAADNRSEVTDELKSIKEGFALEDMGVVTPFDEFGDGVISSLQLFPSVMVQQHANTLAIRNILPKSVRETELSWTYYGYADDDEEMHRRRMKQGNLVGPSGYVSLEDSEVLAQLQPVADNYPDSVQVIEMGGREIGPTTTAITETLLRAFYAFYRREMGL
ncbi:MAG: Rieske 2Fe-2S domain-containing protein [Pseudomonadota bacterium]|jgi:anthranilate 1,2-dioxygenase large subunit